MKKLLPIALILLLHQAATGQNVGINNTGSPADPSAMLDISSNSKGILIPRLRTIERLAIASPARGLMVFDVDTNSFWYCIAGGVWKEITNNTDGPKGPASGDLSGSYPNPYVTGIVNKAIQGNNPLHLQVMRFDNDLDEWRFSNDSLILPYNVTDTSAGSLFSITNTKSGLAGSVLVGRYQGGSSMMPSFSGVWGDHTIGNGVSGTSNSGFGVFGGSNSSNGVTGNSTSGIGVIGTSMGNHAVYGDGNSINHAGVYGRNTTGGKAIWGDATTGNSYAIYGANASGTPASRAGLFTNTNATGTGTVLEANSTGLGRVAEFVSLNTSNTQATVSIQQNGGGRGLSSAVLNTGATFAAVEGSNNGTGPGIHGHGTSGMGVYGSSIYSNAGYFETLSPAGTNPTIVVQNSSSGPGITVTGNSTSNTTDLGILSNFGTGRTLYAYNSNSSSTSAVAQFSSSGQGTSLRADCNNTTSSAPVTFINNNGNGNALEANNQGQGMVAKLTNFNVSNTVPLILAEHKGSGRGIDLRITKTTNNSSGAYIQHDGIGTGLFVMQTGTGKGAEINVGNVANTQPGLYINSAAILGADIAVMGSGSLGNPPIGLRSTIGSNAGINSGIAIQGISGLNDNNGRGVMGIARSGGTGSDAVGVYGAGLLGTQAIGIKGISYHSTIDKGSVTGINYSTSSGTGVYGEGQGDLGIGIIGVSGTNNNLSNAAKFKNFYNGNGLPVVQIETNSVGNGIYIEQTHAVGSAASIRVKNNGVAPFLSLEDNSSNKKVEILKSGNIITEGTVTVKDNKGIVRSSTSTQLRTEIVPAVLTLPASMVIPSGHTHEFTVTFAEPFSQPPTVSFGNLYDLAANPEAAFLVASINSVSTTSCKVRLVNPYFTGISLNAGTATWRLIAIGAE